jgi:hypothetical protein
MDNEYDSSAAGDSGASTQPAEADTHATDSTKALVNRWLDKVKAAKKHHAPVFKQMRKNMDLARRGATKEWADSGKYTVPILARHINQAVSTLYAKNPKVNVERRARMMFRVWDGRADSLQAAMDMVAAGLPDPNAMAILEEVAAAQQQNLMFDRMAETMKILWQYYLDEQSANYKQQIKSAVRRSKICKVAWIKLGFQRKLEPKPEVIGNIADITSKLASMEELMNRLQKGEIEEDSPDIETLRRNIEDTHRDTFKIAREGLVLSFPRADQIIVDPKCIHLKSLSGAGWVAEEFEKSPEEIFEIWKRDIGSQFTWHAADGNPYDKDPKDCKARVYEIWDIKNQQRCVVCEGYPDFLVPPSTPDIWTERFWPYFPIVFNEVEHYSEIYPQSDVEHGEHIQNEYNRSRESLREHRIAARPYYVTAKGLDEDEKGKLAHHAAHEVIEMPTLGANQKVEDLLQRGPAANIDPNLYEVEMIFQDLLRAVGTQEANLGGIGGGTATENSIAEGSRSSSHAENVDDVDSVLTELTRAGGQIMLLNLQKETVMEIVGPGAVWPDTPTTREEASKELLLKVEAGSSGRPNRSAELANMERAVPYLIQIGDIQPSVLARRYGELLDLDNEELLAEGMPSITAINAAIAKMQVGATTGDPGSDPNMQGDQGAQNAPSSQENEPGPQPGYTPPAPIPQA